MWKHNLYNALVRWYILWQALYVGHSLNKIPNDLLFGSNKEMDHPHKADAAAAHRALRKQCDPRGPTKDTQTAEDANKQKKKNADKHTLILTYCADMQPPQPPSPLPLVGLWTRANTDALLFFYTLLRDTDAPTQPRTHKRILPEHKTHIAGALFVCVLFFELPARRGHQTAKSCR